MSKRKPGSYYVDREVQGALVVRCLCHWGLYAGITFVLLWAMQVMTGDPDLPWAAHLAALWERYALFVLVLVALLPAFMFDLMKLTHRFAGPMVRFRRALGQLGAGQSAPLLKFREGDVWNDLASNFNAVVERIEQLEARAEEAAPGSKSSAADCAFDCHVLAGDSAVTR